METDGIMARKPNPDTVRSAVVNYDRRLIPAYNQLKGWAIFQKRRALNDSEFLEELLEAYANQNGISNVDWGNNNE